MFPNFSPTIVVPAFAGDVGASAAVGHCWIVLAFASNDVGASAGVGERWVVLAFASNDVGASAGVGEVGIVQSWYGYILSFWFVVVLVRTTTS